MKRRNKFSLSHYKLFSCKMGQLIPIGLTEVLPGDTIQQSTSVFIRFSPMVAPVMHPVHVKIHHWYVPFRLIWDDFEDFITGGPDGLNDSEPPYVNLTKSYKVIGSLFDYFGVPPTSDLQDNAFLKVSSLPARAYRLVWNEWYRDQNLQEEKAFSKASGRDTATLFPSSGSLEYSSWGKDYFTTATPWEQKGIAMAVPVNGTPRGAITITGNGAPTFVNPGATFQDGNQINVQVKNSPTSLLTVVQGGHDSLTWDNPNLTASFTGEASLGTVDLNQLREAFALQRFEEHRALYGSRYVEYLRYLGIKASDARLQRPEYLGGGRSTIQFSEVLQTAGDGDTPVGTMRGHGIGAIRTNRYRRFIEEHGLILTLMTVRPISVYTQGLPRMFSRWTKEDYWQKELEHVGQQEIRNSEVYVASSDPNGTFGFTDRYDEYRSTQSGIAGEFRTLLNYWHFGREFAEEPVLNGDFVSSPPTNRPFADQTGNDTLYVMANHSIQARRLVSRKGTPI